MFLPAFTLMLVGAVYDETDTGCVDDASLARELRARAPDARVDCFVTAADDGDAVRVRVVVTNLEPPVEREITIRDVECAEAPRAIALIVAATFEQRDVLDGPSLFVDVDDTRQQAPEARPVHVADGADVNVRKEEPQLAPVATVGAGVGLGAPLFLEATIGGGVRTTLDALVAQVRVVGRQTSPVALGATTATLSTVAVAPDAGWRFNVSALGVGIGVTPRLGVELGAALALRLDGKATAFLPRADGSVAVDVDVLRAGPTVTFALRVPFARAVLVNGAQEAREPVAWLAGHATWIF